MIWKLQVERDAMLRVRPVDINVHSFFLFDQALTKCHVYINMQTNQSVHLRIQSVPSLAVNQLAPRHTAAFRAPYMTLASPFCVERHNHVIRFSCESEIPNPHWHRPSQ